MSESVRFLTQARIKTIIETNGMDTVFRIYDFASSEINMFENWGAISFEDVKDWTDTLRNFGCTYARLLCSELGCMS